MFLKSFTGLLGDSDDLDDLGWIIPAVVAVIAAFIGVALACYFGVRRCELRMLTWCYRNCSCCCALGGGEGGRLLGGELTQSLASSSGGSGSVRLKGG